MFQKPLLAILSVLLFQYCGAQERKDSLAVDTSLLMDYEDLFSELDALIDSLASPRSFLLLNIAAGQNHFTYQPIKDGPEETRKQLVLTPSLSYFHKTGAGLSATASVVNSGDGLAPYQYSVAGSYDYLKNKALATGISFTHYITKSDLPFYTSPLQNEVYAYFSLRKLWFRPSIGVSYGWGSREDFEERATTIQNINLARRGFTRINTTERISDFNLFTSVRHDFYFLDLLHSDYIRLTPQLSFVSGTQQFGFNQTANSYITVRRSGRNVLYASENIALDDALYFQPVSLTAFIKAEYAKGKFYVQPQVLFDYYFPASRNNFTTAVLLNTGWLF
jgi:hypothetical protein